MADLVIEASGVGYGYAGGVEALRDVSLRVGAGESVGIVGASGAGKSTLLALVAGVHTPNRGRLVVGGVVSAHDTLPALRAISGLVFQNPDDQLFMQTVRDDVAFGPLNMGLSDTEVAERVSTALADVGAGHLSDRPPHFLSGGEKRAVSIATVLAMNPAILLLDEPSSGLDPVLRRGLIRLIPSLRGTRIVASHDLDLVLEVCDRVLILDGGMVAADGQCREVLSDGELLAAHRLELPLGLQACPRCGRESASRA